MSSEQNGGGHDGGHSGGHDEIEENIRKTIREDNKVTKKQLSQMLEISVRTIERRMTDIEYVDSGNHGHWEIKR